MTEVVQAKKRETIGTGASRRLRKQGWVPAIIYGENQPPISISVEQNKIFHALNRQSFHSNILQLTLEEKSFEVIVRDFQMHPYLAQVQHIDFQVIDAKKPIKINIPIKFINGDISTAVKLHGGMIFKIANSIEIYALAKDIPEELVVDLKNISAGQILHAADIQLPKGVEIACLKRNENPAIVSATGKAK